MPINKDKLQSLRQKIDAIDNSLHDLIMERTQVVEEVRLVKQGEKIKIRPAREAEIIYRLIGRHKGPFPKQELARIWRELIVATLRFEGPFSVAVSESDHKTGYWDLARDQYGSFTPTTKHHSHKSVVNAVRDQTATVGILPMPKTNDTEHWWPFLLSDKTSPVLIMARLPFIPGDNSNKLNGFDALVISTVPQEKTGRDHSFLTIESQKEISNEVIENALAKVKLPIIFQQKYFNPKLSTTWLHLIEVDGFVDSENSQLSLLKKELANKITSVSHLGGYAKPLEPSEVVNNINFSKEGRA